MSDFKKYKPNSIRLKNYDYSSQGEYFVTICTKDMVNYFGEINEEHEMVLSEIGKVAEKCWSDIPKHFPNVELDIHQVMPNHLHGIIRIVFDGNKPGPDGRDTKFCVSTGNNNDNFQNKFGPQSRNLGSIIRGFKSAVKKYATINNIPFQWQPNYYEEIIKNEKHYSEIYGYIQSNPQTWDRDRNNPLAREIDF